MLWSITIGRIAGTAVRIHVTFILFLVWIGASALRQDGGDAAFRNVLFIVLLFGCVLLHEFGHAFALSDTYQGGQSGNCQANQPQAVMCNTSFDTPQTDDVAGIRSVYQSTFPNG